MDPASELAELLECGIELGARGRELALAAEFGSRLDSRPRRISASETSRCWAPSWRSRSMRRRAVSAASTIRVRDAASCSRASTLASAAVTSSAKLLILASVPAGNACASSLDAMTAPQRRPAT